MHTLPIKYSEQWLDLRGHLERVVDNEVRLFNEADLIHLDDVVGMTDKALAASLARDFLQHSPLDGELLEIYAARLGIVIGYPITLKLNEHSPIDDRSAWVTNPEAKTFEIGW